MAHHTIELPEATYQLLLKQAAHLQLPPEHVLERLVIGDLVLSSIEDDAETDLASAATNTAEALAAVERLTSLFADVSIRDLEQHLTDPMLALANEDEDDFADEVARTRQNAALMQLLHERSQEQTRYSAQQVRERLGLDKP